MAIPRAVSIGLRWVAVPLFALLLALAALYGLLHTRAGLDFAADRIGGALSDETTTVRIGRIEGWFGSRLAVERITLADARGVYATAEGLRLEWTPWALARRVVEIKALTADRLTLDRLPEAGGGAPREAATPIPLPPVGLRADRIAVDEIALAAPVFGEAQRLAATATVRMARDLGEAKIGLSLRRTDGRPDRAELELAYATRPARFAARIKIEEPKGGMLARLAGLPAGTPLRIALDGEGPPEAWRGTLDAKAGDGLAARSSVSVALARGALTLSLDGTAAFARLLPTDLRALAAPSVRLQATLGLTPGKAITVTGLAARSDLLDLTGSGRYGLADEAIEAELTAKARTGRPLAGLIPGAVVSGAEVKARIMGTTTRPRAELRITTGRISAGTLGIGAASGTLTAAPAAGGAFDLASKIRFSGVDPGGAVPKGVLGPAMDLTAAARLSGDGAIETLRIGAVSGGAKLELQARRDGAGPATGDYTLALGEIAALAKAADLDLKGGLRASGAFEAELATGAVKTTLAGALMDLSGGPPWLAGVAGRRVPFSGAIDWQDGKPLAVTGLTIEPQAGRLSASGAVDFASGALSAEAVLIIPELAALSDLAGTKLAGAAKVEASVTGTLADPEAQGQATLAKLGVDGRAIGSFGLGFSLRQDGAATAGSLRLKGDALANPLAGTLKVRAAPNAIEIREIDLTLAGNRVTGNLGYDPRRDRLSGRLAAEVKEIAELPGADAVGLTGAATATLTASPEGTGALDAVVAVSRLAGPGGEPLPVRVTGADIKLRVENPLADPTLSGEAVVAYRLRTGSSPGRATMKISGTFAKLGWSSEISTPQPYAAAFALGGAVELGEAQTRLTVAALEGAFEKQAIKLQAPFTATFGARGWRVSPIDLGLAGGHLGFSAAMEGDALDARGKLEGLPLRLAALFEPRAAVDGTASGTFSLSGPLANPTLSASFDARDIRPEGAAKDAVPVLTARLRLDQSGDGTRAEAEIKGPEATAMTARLTTGPLLGSRAAPAEAPIAGEVKANVRLALIAELLGLGEDRVSGDLNGTLEVSGTLARPRLQGEARLGGGSYEGARTGTILRGIEALARFDGDKVRLVSLTAGDGEAGRLSAKGAVRITDGPGAEEGLELTLDRFTGLRHPTAEIQATGTVRLAGPLAAPRIAGKLRTERGEIRIPDRLAEDIVELDVVEVNLPPARAERAQPEEDPSLGKALAIALAVALDVPGKTFVRGRGLDSEWKGNLAITGTTAAPVIKGRLQAVRGTFAFAGKTFVVKRGAVTFPPGGGAEPEIAAMAEAKLTDITARIEISGTVSKPEIAVSSDPPLPQEEVLAQILFGRSAGQLTAVQAAQLVQTAATLSGKGGGPGIVDRIRSTLGVDVLSVESGEGGQGGASLKAGNYLTEDVFLSVTQGTQPGSQKVGVEVKVTPHVSMESNISGNADSNIGVNWKWDY